MTGSRHGAGRVVVLIGTFFVSEGLIKLHWFGDTSDLAGRFAGYLEAVGAGSFTGWYLQQIAMPGCS